MSRFPNLSAPHLPEEQRRRACERLDELYLLVSTNWPGFIEREGQLTLMQSSLETLLNARTEKRACNDGSNLAALEAGTGTGKTIGYCLAAIVASEILGMKVVVSTATVALQEQLYFKDLPRLAGFIPSLSFELLKGRSRYVCQSKLELAMSGEIQGDWLEVESGFAASDDDAATSPSNTKRLDERTVVWLKEIDHALNKGAWNGEMDNLGTMPDEADWRTVQADAHACGGARCEHFKSCAFFSARRKAQDATLQIANHALVLATIANDAKLINPATTLFIFDEAHHLPDISNEQFSYKTRLGHGQRALIALRRSIVRANRLLPVGERIEMPAIDPCIQQSQKQLAMLQAGMTEEALVSPDNPVHRFLNGNIAEFLSDECQQLATGLHTISQSAEAMYASLIQVDESISPAQRNTRLDAANDLGPHLSRLAAQRNLFRAWSTHDTIPLAKWVEFVDSGHGCDAMLCASPMTGAQGLVKGLWREVGAAVCTSATLSACGSFDYFERMSGLNRYPKHTTGRMPSPFDYSRQGELRMPTMQNSPKQPQFSQELCDRMPDLLSDHPLGQLVLFTSKRQMYACYTALPEQFKTRVLVQGHKSRQTILSEHRTLIHAGESSIIFGLQSMGEGLDLPGALCEHVIVDRLPFTPPSSPVDQALAEWLTTQGRDAFEEIVVPRASMRLSQWVGRGVRTVTDHATITICDSRLKNTRFGRRILAGLPPFARH